MKNRMAFTRWRSRQDLRNPGPSRSALAPGGRIGAEELGVRFSDAWRTWEAASSSEFFNRFVFRSHQMRAKATPAFGEDWIYFQDQAWTLDARARATLRQRMPLFRANRARRIVIGGIASEPGTIANGMRLGLRRVLSIRTYLVAHRIDPDRIGIAIRGTAWSLTESAGEADNLNGGCREYRLQVADPHWVLARN